MMDHLQVPFACTVSWDSTVSKQAILKTAKTYINALIHHLLQILTFHGIYFWGQAGIITLLSSSIPDSTQIFLNWRGKLKAMSHSGHHQLIKTLCGYWFYMKKVHHLCTNLAEINDLLRDIEYTHNILGFLCIHTAQNKLRFDNQLIKTKIWFSMWWLKQFFAGPWRTNRYGSILGKWWYCESETQEIDTTLPRKDSLGLTGITWSRSSQIWMSRCPYGNQFLLVERHVTQHATLCE
jgi:hypothetical protein